MSRYLQGKYILKNPMKYVGDKLNVVYRSSWELKAMIFFDNNPGILRWASEESIIPYLSKVDGKMHRYFVDFTVLYQTKSGEKKKALVEIKPRSQTIEPKVPKRQTKRYINEVTEYIKNTSKWEAAKKWADEHGLEFMILDEYSLGIK